MATLATFGAGCFWCVEACFQRLKGVKTVKSGYMGGSVSNPSYQAVCSGKTGHVEVIQVDFDPKIITFEDLCSCFFLSHDPTQLNRQGNDVGTQYRSAIFYHDNEQKDVATKLKDECQKSVSSPIVTEITAASTFYVAEDYHQNYFNMNPNQGYCQHVVKPKVEKFKKVFLSKLK
eukprot:gene379-6793_t